MKKQYKQLNLEEREKKYTLLAEGKTQQETADIIGRDKSTISRELSRNNHERLDEYLPDTAQRKADKRKTYGRKKEYLVKDWEFKQYVISKLGIGWSPEQIEGRIEQDIGKLWWILYSTHIIRPGRAGRLQCCLFL